MYRDFAFVLPLKVGHPAAPPELIPFVTTALLVVIHFTPSPATHAINSSEDLMERNGNRFDNYY